MARRCLLEIPPVTPRHIHRASIRWTGNLGRGTRDYLGYSRNHTIQVPGRPAILATSSLSPQSDPSRYNPDDLLVAALSSCHMLWYLHLCSEAGVTVTAYDDDSEGILEHSPDGSGRFIGATLRPRVTITDGSLETAIRLHEEAHRKCYLANSVNFPVKCEPSVQLESANRSTEGTSSGRLLPER
ncbi:MAG: OsmC family protein [Thermoplasmata archaeon]|nr:OsmC family protein [Thermoplasmata archaeon]